MWMSQFAADDGRLVYIHRVFHFKRSLFLKKKKKVNVQILDQSTTEHAYS